MIFNTYKKIFLLTTLALLLFSCSSDDSENKLEDEILIGSWEFQRHGETCSNGFDLEEGPSFDFIFHDNNTVEFTEPGYLTSSYYELIDNELTLETVYTLPSGNTREFVGTYTYSEDTNSFTGTNTFSAFDNGETLWTCNGTTSIFRE